LGSLDDKILSFFVNSAKTDQKQIRHHLTGNINGQQRNQDYNQHTINNYHAPQDQLHINARINPDVKAFN